MKRRIAAVAALSISAPAFGAIYNYHPNSTVYLGGGFDPYNPTQGFRECLTWNGVKPIDSSTGNTAVETTALVQAVKTKKDFYNLVDFSTQIQGSYGLFSGEASVDLIDEYAFHEDSLTWVVLFKTDYGRFRIENPQLKAEFASEDAETLEQKCGTEVALTERRGVMVYAVLTVKNLSENKRREFETKLSVSAQGAFWSAEMDSEYKKVLRSALAATDFSVRIRAIGGNGVTDLTDLIGSSGGEDAFVQYTQIPDTIRTYIEGLTVSGAAPLQYITADISTFRSDIPRGREPFQSVQFEKIYTSYERHSSVVDRLEDFLYGGSAALYSLNKGEFNDFEDLLNSHKQARDALFTAGLACFDEAASCVEPNVRRRAVVWPRPKKFAQLCEANRLSAYNAGLVPLELYQIAKNRDFVFIVEDGEIKGQERCDVLFF